LLKLVHIHRVNGGVEGKWMDDKLTKERKRERENERRSAE
jgi:hypothetical protein